MIADQGKFFTLQWTFWRCSGNSGGVMETSIVYLSFTQLQIDMDDFNEAEIHLYFNISP